MKVPLRLYNDATSPFGRKVLIACLERQISIEEVFIDIKEPAVLEPWNPIRQIPTLVSADGMAIFDSDVIVQYLDGQQGGAPLIPSDVAITVLVRMSLANGLMETTLKRVVETRRAASDAAILVRLEATIWRALGAIEAQIDKLEFDGILRADQISIAAALGYVDFRFTRTWSERYPKLQRWFQNITTRDSMIISAPTRSMPIST